MNESFGLKQKLMLANRLKSDASLTMKLSDNILDLKKWCKDEDILNFLLDENVDQLVVDKVINPNEVAHNLEESKTCEEFLQTAKKANVYINKKEREALNKNFESEKKVIFNRIQSDIVLGSKKFIKIQREAVRRFNDESIWYLYVSGCFLTGKTIDGSIVKAPLILYRVEVVDRDGEIVIVKREKDITINEKLNLFLNQAYDLNINMQDESNLKELSKYNQLLKPLTSNQGLNLLEQHELVDFGEFEISDVKMEIEPSATFGLMDPCGGIVLLDYEKIVKSGVDPFKELSVISNANSYEQEVIDKDDIVMFNRPLNVYQKYAVKSALGESTLIFGPPGTGKSEVIATIIANILTKNKTVLMVSEKKAALDVLEERLNAIGDICLFAYNTEDTTYFYNKIRRIHDLLNNDSNDGPLSNAEQTYFKIKEMYSDLKSISNLIVNNKHLDEINYINKNFKFDKSEIKFAIKLINQTNEHNLNILFQECYDVFYKILANKEYFPEIINKEEMNELLKTANSYSDPDVIWRNYFVNHKIKKPLLFAKIKTAKNLDLETLKYVVEWLAGSDLNEISLSEVEQFVSWHDRDIKRLQDEVESYLLTKQLMKIDYLSKPLLDTLLSNYISNQKRIVKNVDMFIRDNYINQLRQWIQNIEKSNDVETQNQLKELFRIASLKKAKSVNLTIKKYYKVLRKLFPIWILNPVQTSQVTPCDQGIFDYGIFDEASQMFYENSYPLIYRVKNSVVCGDDKQLSPIGNFVSKSFDDSYNLEQDYDDDESSIVSLFEKASTLSWPHFQLKNHYRSTNADLISFANSYIYNGEMQTATINGHFYKAVEIKNVDGYLDGQINQAESDYVIQLLADKYNSRKENDDSSILVVGLNNKQMEFMESEFNNKIKDLSPRAYDAYRIGELSFGSVENIQGLEADEVIISFTYAKDKNGELRTNFGVMGQEGGIARLNVAITRAKDKMTIVKSINYRDTIPSTNENLTALFEFIEWCDKMEKSPSLKEVIKTQEIDVDEFETDFEKEVYSVLKNQLSDNEDFKILYKLKVGTKTIDFAIIDNKTEKVCLGIQLDDFSYSYGLKKMIEELDAQKLLEDRGYKMARITLVDWRVRNELVLSEIKSLLENYK